MIKSGGVLVYSQIEELGSLSSERSRADSRKLRSLSSVLPLVKWQIFADVVY